jgi:hypothetical protein
MPNIFLLGPKVVICLQVKRILAKVAVLNSNFGPNLNRVGVGIC